MNDNRNLETVEEARQKLCIQAAFYEADEDHEEEPVRCAGSGCMGWRWVIPEDGGVSTHGYCGLVGKP